jgi:hypothetical protein
MDQTQIVREIEKARVREAIIRQLDGGDYHDYRMMRDQFADEVTIDFGGVQPRLTQTAEALVQYAEGSGASADNSPCSAAGEPPVTLGSDGNRLEIRHLCFAACQPSARQRVCFSPKSPDAPEPSPLRSRRCRVGHRATWTAVCR